MVKSMYAAVAGLRTHQSKLDVIGNNIANVNTYGYKKERAIFADTYYATSRASANANGVIGGQNPSQVGYGVKVAGVSAVITTGGNAITDNPTDVMITGNGYFLVGSYNANGYTTISSESGAGGVGSITGLNFTRVGMFNFDGQGSLVDGNGYYVYGFSSVRGEQALADADNFKVDDTTGLPSVTNNWKYESNGTTYTVHAVFNEDGSVSRYDVYDEKISGNDGTPTTDKDPVLTLSAGDFDPESADSLYILPTTGEYSDADTYTVDQNTGYVKNRSTGIVATGSDVLNTIQQPRVYTFNDYCDKDGNPLQIMLFSENDSVQVRAYKKDDDGNIKEVDGTSPITAGGEDYWNLGKPIEMASISIGADGTVSGIYTKDNVSSVYSLGKIAVANVPNATALEATGNNYYMARNNTGVIQAFNPGEGATGTLQAETLEMSNVDLANEFTEMITTQRGFQANSRIITVTDSMLEELVNLKRS